MIATRQRAVVRRWSWIAALGAALTLALAGAEQLVQAGKYQEAYDLLAPFEDARSSKAAKALAVGLIEAVDVFLIAIAL